MTTRPNDTRAQDGPADGDLTQDLARPQHETHRIGFTTAALDAPPSTPPMSHAAETHTNGVATQCATRPLRVSIFGMGYVGTVSAGCLARMGHTVIGLDANPTKVEMLAAGRSPVIEPGLAELISGGTAQHRISVSTDAVQAVRDTDITLYCVGTPGHENGGLNLDAVRDVCQSIGAALRQKNSFHVVVTRSTMLPGTTRSLVIPLLEAVSGKRAGVDFGVAVYPEFLREGTALDDFDHPPLVVMASSDERTQRLVAELNPGKPEAIVHTAFEVAEMMKYANNTWHAVKVAFANEIGSFCRAHGVDGNEVMDIFMRDQVLNISKAYLRPGFAFGGSCLPKDLRALLYKSKELDLETPLLSAVLASNQLHIQRLIDRILSTKQKKVGILGLSFKYGTDDLRDSPTVILVESLLGKGCRIRIYDSEVSLARIFGANKAYIEHEISHISTLMCSEIDEVLELSDVIVVAKHQEEIRRSLTPYLG